MTERSVKVTLRANVADFNRQIKSAATSLEQLAAKGDPTGKVAETTMGRLAQSAQLQRAAWDTASTAMVGYGVAAAAASAYVVRSFADFDSAMSNVQAATHESAENMNQLREAAIQAGADTAFSASEAAGAIEELAKAGVSTADILNGGLKGSLDLAAAGGLGVADAAGIASVALTQFKLSGSDVGHVADLLAAGAGKAMGDVSDLGMALKQSGLVASQTGLRIDETTGALASFAAAGLLGSDAGTSFKTMLLNMTPQSKQAAKYMEELGIHAYDAQGQFVGLAAYAGQLHDSLSKLTAEDRQAALKKMFGQDAIRAASILYEQGAEGIQSWIDKVNDAGYAAETANARMDNLKGDIEKLGGSFETLFIKSGSGANSFLRSIVQGAEQAVNAFSALPAPVQQGALGLAAFTSAAALAAGGGMKLFTMVMDIRTAMQSLNGSIPFLPRHARRPHGDPRRYRRVRQRLGHRTRERRIQRSRPVTGRNTSPSGDRQRRQGRRISTPGRVRRPVGPGRDRRRGRPDSRPRRLPGAASTRVRSGQGICGKPEQRHGRRDGIDPRYRPAQPVRGRQRILAAL